jgi:hypothetical protein
LYFAVVKALVGGSGQEEPPLQALRVAPAMVGAKAQGRKQGPQGGTEPFHEGRVDCPALALFPLNEVKRLRQGAKRKSALYPLSVRPFEDLDDVQFRLLNQPRASTTPALNGAPVESQHLRLPDDEPVRSPEARGLKPCNTVNMLHHIRDHRSYSS